MTDLTSKKTSFIFCSCQYPADVFFEGVANASFTALANYVRHNDVAFALFLGDQVYVDRTGGLFDPEDPTERYSKPTGEFLTKQRALLPKDFIFYTSIDDHELNENWEPIDERNAKPILKTHADYYQYGLENYIKHLASPYQGLSLGRPLWSIVAEPLALFIADSRTERGKERFCEEGSARKATNIERIHIMSIEQREAIKKWLIACPPAQPKFISSPSLFLPRRSHTASHDYPAAALRSDTWDGFPNSLLGLLAYIADHNLEQVYFLSGDEHMACVATATITHLKNETQTVIRSVHTPALHAPFPFANSQPSDLALQDCFNFRRLDAEQTVYCDESVAEYVCTVSAYVPETSDGFAVMHVIENSRGSDAKFQVRCEFRAAAGTSFSEVI